MKILFALSSPEYVRHYDTVMRTLAARGHDVVVAVGAVRDGKPARLEALRDTAIEVAGLVPGRDDEWTDCARAIRGTMDFVRYLHPDLSSATALRERVKRQTLPSGLQGLDRVHALPAGIVKRCMNGLARLDRAIPPAASLLRFLDGHAPDLVLVSPLIEPASDQVDLVRAAQARGLRVATLIASWDNLTNKGDLRVITDRIMVWNEAQRREAVEYHRAPPQNVVVTGAQSFDHWFGRSPSRSRDEFCVAVGLPDAKPFVLFTGSSIFIARADAEMRFVRRWIEALRQSTNPQVRQLAILIRPHPYNGRAWNAELFADLSDVTVWPRGGYDPAEQANRDGLFDSLFHCEAVVGINTSAMIEAAIVGRSVLSITPPEFAGTQGGTLHFHHLLPENGGFLRVASTLDEHTAQLSAVLGDRKAAERELSQFVGSFVRPFGLDEPATPRLVNEIESYGRATTTARRRTAVDRLLETMLRPVSRLGGWLQPPAVRKAQQRTPTPAARVATRS